MTKDSIVVETNKTLGRPMLDSIKNMIEKRFGFTASEVTENVNSKTVGGIIISFTDYKIVLKSDDISSLGFKNENVIIESQRELSDKEKVEYFKYAQEKFGIGDDTKLETIVNDQIIAGARIRYKDEEIDLTLDKLIDKAFSKI